MNPNKALWEKGDFTRIAASMRESGDALAEKLGVKKGSLFADDLRDQKAAKIACGAVHFKALAVDKNPARYVKATKLDDVPSHVDT